MTADSFAKALHIEYADTTLVWSKDSTNGRERQIIKNLKILLVLLPYLSGRESLLQRFNI
jgi:hypothetical protein